MYYTYMLRCDDNSIYTGMTKDIKRRIEEHFSKDKKCAKYTLRHTAKKIEAVWESDSRSSASKLEYHIKKLKKEEKEELIKKGNIRKYLENKIVVEEYKRIKID